MKRFKDCYLKCNINQSPAQLLSLVEDVCANLKLKTSSSTIIKARPCITVELSANKLPDSRVVVSALEDRGCVGIVNIVPLRSSGISSLDYDTYNAVLDMFKSIVFDRISLSQLNIIEETEAEYSIEDLIPKSYQSLNMWLDNYPLSWHPNDEQRWFDFLIALVDNNETLRVDDLSKYINERCSWKESELLDLEIRYETQIRLLRYYVEHNCR